MAPSLIVVCGLGLSKMVQGQVKKKTWKKGVYGVASSVWLVVAASTCGVSTKLTVNLSSPSPPCSKLLCSRFEAPEGKELHTLALLPLSSQGEELLYLGLVYWKGR